MSVGPIDWHRPFSSLSGKRAVVTGGSRGIGKAVVTALCEVGARVILTGRSEDALRDTVEELKSTGGDAAGVVAHSRRPEDLERLMAGAADRFGGLDLLVNNVGANPAISPLHELDEDLFDIVWETNVRGYLTLSRLAVPLLTEDGSIVNMSSIGGFVPAKDVGAYSISKAAVNMLTRQMALELAPEGIRVNAVAPAVIETRFSEAYWKEGGALYQGVPPIGRFGTPDEVAAVVLFLASDLAGFITGEIVVMDGGQRSLSG